MLLPFEGWQILQVRRVSAQQRSFRLAFVEFRITQSQLFAAPVFLRVRLRSRIPPAFCLAVLLLLILLTTSLTAPRLLIQRLPAQLIFQLFPFRYLGGRGR